MIRVKYNEWDRKQLMDIVSKGINSVLMQKPEVPISKLEELAKGLLKIYKQIHLELAPSSKGEEVNLPE